jgi:bacteriorhodopsin
MSSETKSDSKRVDTPIPQPKYGRLLGDTFLTTYIVLFGYTAITLIEAIRTPSVNVRHIMNIETSVSLVAGLVYGIFLERIKEADFKLQDILHLRYLDWMISTPLILLGLLLFYNNRLGSINYKTYGIIIVLNWLMLIFGYLGEFGSISPTVGVGVGSFFLVAMLAYILFYAIPKGSSTALFWFFAIIWSSYGVAYTFDEEAKNISYNILDLMSKAIFGIILWLYFGRVVSFH